MNVMLKGAVGMALVLAGFSTQAQVKLGDIPQVEPASKVPSIIARKNEVAIASSFVGNPEAVLGALLDTESGELLLLERYVSNSAKPRIDTKAELVFKDLVEKNVAAAADYLGIVSGSLDDKKKAEVTLTRNSYVSLAMTDLKQAELEKKIRAMKPEDLAHYGLVIGYTDYLLTATYFVEAGKKAEAKGFGANVGGKWYNRSEGSTTTRTVVAQYAPLRLVTPVLKSSATSAVSLQSLLDSSIENTDLVRSRVLEVRD